MAKTRKFEKVVKWENTEYLSITILINLLVILIFVAGWMKETGAIILLGALSIVFIIRSISTIKRKVYWKEIKGKK